VVNIVEQWKDMEAYASNASQVTVRAYQTTMVGDKTQIRVLVGKYGFIKDFENCDDKELFEIIKFCSKTQFLSINGTIPDDKFFK
jgi:ribosomal protein S8